MQDFFDEEKGFRISQKVEESVKMTDNDELMEARQSETFFQSATVNSCKMKIDYTPVGVDVASLQKGNYAELLNMFPLESMVLDFDPLEIKGLTGWGNLFGEMCKRWVSNIAATQVHKFVQSTPPFNVLSNVVGAAADLVVVPMQEYKKKPDRSGLARGVRRGAGQVRFSQSA